MKAIVRRAYGSPDVLELREVDTPVAGDDDVLVRIRATSVNLVDWHALTGLPYIVRSDSGLRRPKRVHLGTDFAGTVEAVGGNVRQFRPGDDVFGWRGGAFAEYVSAPEDRIVPKPAGLSFEQAAAVPVAGGTALQALRDKGAIRPGQRVLINGASGGVGTFAVQMAKAFGADVTGVCSTANVESVRSIGADRVVDYTREDFVRDGPRYDLLIDIAGSRSWTECRRVLVPTGRAVIVGGPGTNRWLGPLAHMIGARMGSLVGGRKAVPFIAALTNENLVVMGELLGARRVTPVIDRSYTGLPEIADALRYIGEGHARGKVVVTV